MLRSPQFRTQDVAQVRRLVEQNPWATLVSSTSTGLVASHYPVLLDPEPHEGISLVAHVGRPDDSYHELGQHEVLVVVAGAHDYVSASWYPAGELVPTWNHLSAHLWGVPQVLGEEENYAMLRHLTDHFEAGRDGARDLLADEAGTRKKARGTRGFRLRVTRFEARWKLSQNKDPQVAQDVVDHLEPVNPALAQEMRAVRGCPFTP